MSSGGAYPMLNAQNFTLLVGQYKEDISAVI